MKITIEESPSCAEEEIIFRCHAINSSVLSLMEKLRTVSSSSLIGSKGEFIASIRFKDIYYVEANENKTFLYLDKDIYESKQKLYELERLLPQESFFRCSKSLILNCDKIDCLKASFNGRFEARLLNGENVVINRQYVPILKERLGI